MPNPPPKVGDTFQHQRQCDRYRPIYYAGASGDFNPIHIDGEVGKAAGMGGWILQGMCTMAWAVEAALLAAPDPGKLRRVRVRFSKPVQADDLVDFQTKVTKSDEQGVTVEVSAKNQRGEDVLKGVTAEIAR
jgi:acyl dehydratase